MPGGDNGFLYVLQGSLVVGERRAIVGAGELAWLTRSDGTDPSVATVTADAEPARVLILSGRPLNEPVVFGGPFVMNSQEDIRQAFEDYRAGRF